MTWISFRNFHINLAAKPAKLSMPPPYTEYQSDCVCVCVCAWTKIRSAGKEGGGRLVSYVVACELSQRPKGCALRVVESCNCSQTERESKKENEIEQEQERKRDRARQVKSKTEWSSHAAAMSIHFAVSTCSECEHLHLKASAPPLCPYPWLPLHKLVL